VEQAPQGERLSERVTQHLQMFVERFPSTPEVARAFDLSERSLRRRLQEEGTSFRALVNEVKMQKAQQWLEHTPQSVEHIAQQLGYAEAAAFIHAFSRWTGSSPAAYRAAMKRAAASPGA
jgi:AraC-like DNA-binding protein